MAELNLKQITDRLNAEFASASGHRKLVFWYDDRAEFLEEIDSLELENAKILKLQEKHQFEIKYFLERKDMETNYLIYAPFPKPDVRQNHLEDILLYSKRFYADRVSLLMVDLHMSEDLKPVVEKHIAFFANKDRTKRFYELEIEHYTRENFLIGMLSAICRTRTCSLDEVLRVLLTEGQLEDSKYLVEFQKYGLLTDFWFLVGQEYGYSDPQPSLQKLVVTLFVTYAARYISDPVPEEWKKFLSSKPGNDIAFLDSLMNSVLYREKYDELSGYVASVLHAPETLKSYAPEALVSCDSFAVIDEILLRWVRDRLQNEDIGARLGEMGIPAVCEKRKKMHFGSRYLHAWEMLACAYEIVSAVHFQPEDGFRKVVNQYQKEGYRIDQNYRFFYYHLDQLESSASFENLRVLVENIYTNDFLGRLLPRWNSGMMEENAQRSILLQRNFYTDNVASQNDRVVVIISDAMRYEVGQELFAKLSDDPKSTVSIKPMLSTVPSYTRLGMSALLPHKKLELSDDGQELVDGKACIDLISREKVLQSWQPDSCCVQFDAIKNLNTADLRKIFTGKRVVYVYHDQIDVRGEHTEDEVFTACEEAVEEIQAFILKVHNNANTHHFIVTSDHGFIYKRNKVQESDKIGGLSAGIVVKRRYIVSHQPIQEDGVRSLSLGYILGNDDDKIVSFPVGTSVFKTQGSGGQNYVHGGSSPQEMLVPVIDVKMEKGKAETTSAQIMLVSLVHKITNLITTLDFIQTEPVSDVVKPATYKVCFIDGNGQTISNEAMVAADKRDSDSAKRLFRLRFTFRNQKYDRGEQYYLIAVDTASGLEAFRHQVTMDLAFADDFGFGI